MGEKKLKVEEGVCTFLERQLFRRRFFENYAALQDIRVFSFPISQLFFFFSANFAYTYT